MSVMKKVMTTTVAVAAVTAGLAAGTLPANAGSTDCKPGNRICLWEDDGFRGIWGAWDRGVPTLGDFRNEASSVWNRSPVAWTLNFDEHGSRATVCVKSGAFSSNLRDFNFTDKTRSITRLPNNNCPAGLRVIS